MLTTDQSQIGTALGRIPSGCAILTATQGGRSTGTLVSWYQQAAFVPPLVTVCLKQGRSITTLIDGSGRFVLNLIGEDAVGLFKHFGKGFTLGEDAFEDVSLTASEYGPVLSDTIAALGCTVCESHPVGDHDLYIAEVKAAHAGMGAKPYVHLRKSGLSY